MALILAPKVAKWGSRVRILYMYVMWDGNSRMGAVISCVAAKLQNLLHQPSYGVQGLAAHMTNSHMICKPGRAREAIHAV